MAISREPIDLIEKFKVLEYFKSNYSHIYFMQGFPNSFASLTKFILCKFEKPTPTFSSFIGFQNMLKPLYVIAIYMRKWCIFPFVFNAAKGQIAGNKLKNILLFGEIL